jgi:hypothetical protein
MFAVLKPLFPPQFVPAAAVKNSSQNLKSRDKTVRLVIAEPATKISFIVISSKWAVSPGNQAMRNRPLKSP